MLACLEKIIFGCIVNGKKECVHKKEREIGKQMRGNHLSLLSIVSHFKIHYYLHEGRFAEDFKIERTQKFHRYPNPIKLPLIKFFMLSEREREKL